MFEFLNTTSIILMLVIGFLSFVSCFCGYHFRKIIACCLGVSFGASIGVAINDIVFGSNVGFLQSLSNAFSFVQFTNGEAASSIIGITLKMLVIPIVCAVLFGTLGSIFYRVVMSLCSGIWLFVFALTFFNAYEHKVLFSALAAVATAGMMYFLYDWFFIILTAAIGAIGLHMVSVELLDWGKGFLMYILFVLGLITQSMVKINHSDD